MAVIDRTIDLTERGASLVAQRTELDASEFGSVCEQLKAVGVLGVSHNGAYTVLEPRQFVGRIKHPGGVLTIAPRWPKLFSALRDFVTYSASKRAIGYLPVAAQNQHLTDSATALIRAFEACLRAGFPFDHTRTRYTTSTPRGRLLIGETIRDLQIHGVRHLVRCESTRRTYDRDLEALVLSAAGVISSAEWTTTAMRLNLSRLCSILTSPPLCSKSPPNAEALQNRYSTRPEVIKLVDICVEVLAGATAVWDYTVNIPGAESRFCNMDRLWENVLALTVRQIVAVTKNITAELHPMARTATHLFDVDGPVIDPDVVVFNQGIPKIVLDAKYSMASAPASSDVYQLYCYVHRLRARYGILVYLSPNSKWIERLGATDDGAELFAVGASIEDPVQDLRALFGSCVAFTSAK